MPFLSFSSLFSLFPFLAVLEELSRGGGVAGCAVLCFRPIRNGVGVVEWGGVLSGFLLPCSEGGAWDGRGSGSGSGGRGVRIGILGR